jgi:hypothetical protein
MATPRIYILTLLILFLLIQCNVNSDNRKESKHLSTAVPVKAANYIAGKWKYNYSIWYTSELILNNNGTFTFHDQGCTGQRFSQGRWTNIDDLVVLTSFESFQQKEHADTANTITQLNVKRRSKKGKVEYIFTGFKNQPMFNLPGPNDTVRVYLNHIQLQLRNDTLYCVGSNKLPEGAKLYRKNNSLKNDVTVIH